MPPGDIVYVNYPDTGGHAQARRRPAVVLQDDGFAHRSPLVVTLPFTKEASTAARFPAVIPVPRTPTNGLTVDSFLLVFQVQATDRTFVDAVPVGTLDPSILATVYDALDRLTGRPPAPSQGQPPAPTSSGPVGQARRGLELD